MARYITGIILAVAVILLLAYAPAVACVWVVRVLSVIAAYEFLSLIGKSFVAQFATTDEFPAKIQRAGLTFAGIQYVALLFGILALVILHDKLFWTFMLLASTFLADSGAYFVGRSLGKHKLAPRLSPGKTVEGLVGGILGGAVGSVVFWLIFHPVHPLWPMPFLGAVLAVTGMLGDLSESMLKRAFGAKDASQLIPGHGGLLDRVDALLFNAPVLYAYLMLTGY
jgi:CDP-diglyceride synthetase